MPAPGTKAIPRWLVHVTMLLVIVVWSGAFTTIKIALRELNPLDLTLLRFLVAAVPFLLVLPFVGWPRFTRAEWPWVALIAFLSVGGYHLALNYGETAVSAGVAALIVATGPVWTAMISATTLKERVTVRKAVGIAVALAGVTLLVLGQGGDLRVGYLVGAFIALLAPVMWAMSSVASKPLLARHPPLAFTTAATLLGTAMLLPVLGTGTAGRALDAGWETWAALLHLGLLATFAGYVLFNVALRQLTATETMTYLYLNPLAALLWAWLLGGETLTTFILLGGLVVIAGVMLTNWSSGTARGPANAAVNLDAEGIEEAR